VHNAKTSHCLIIVNLLHVCVVADCGAVTFQMWWIFPRERQPIRRRTSSCL